MTALDVKEMGNAVACKGVPTLQCLTNDGAGPPRGSSRMVQGVIRRLGAARPSHGTKIMCLQRPLAVPPPRASSGDESCSSLAEQELLGNCFRLPLQSAPKQPIWGKLLAALVLVPIMLSPRQAFAAPVPKQSSVSRTATAAQTASAVPWSADFLQRSQVAMSQAATEPSNYMLGMTAVLVMMLSMAMAMKKVDSERAAADDESGAYGSSQRSLATQNQLALGSGAVLATAVAGGAATVGGGGLSTHRGPQAKVSGLHKQPFGTPRGAGAVQPAQRSRVSAASTQTAAEAPAPAVAAAAGAANPLLDAVVARISSNGGVEATAGGAAVAAAAAAGDPFMKAVLQRLRSEAGAQGAATDDGAAVASDLLMQSVLERIASSQAAQPLGAESSSGNTAVAAAEAAAYAVPASSAPSQPMPLSPASWRAAMVPQATNVPAAIAASSATDLLPSSDAEASITSSAVDAATAAFVDAGAGPEDASAPIVSAAASSLAAAVADVAAPAEKAGPEDGSAPIVNVAASSLSAAVADVAIPAVSAPEPSLAAIQPTASGNPPASASTATEQPSAEQLPGTAATGSEQLQQAGKLGVFDWHLLAGSKEGAAAPSSTAAAPAVLEARPAPEPLAPEAGSSAAEQDVAAGSSTVAQQPPAEVQRLLSSMKLQPISEAPGGRGLAGVRSQFDILQAFLSLEPPTIRSKYDPWTDVRNLTAPTGGEGDLIKVILTVDAPNGTEPAPLDIIGQLLAVQPPTGEANFDFVKGLRNWQPPAGAADFDVFKGLVSMEAPRATSPFDWLPQLLRFNVPSGRPKFDILSGLASVQPPQGEAEFDVIKGLKRMQAPTWAEGTNPFTTPAADTKTPAADVPAGQRRRAAAAGPGSSVGGSAKEPFVVPLGSAQGEDGQQVNLYGVLLPKGNSGGGQAQAGGGAGSKVEAQV